MAQSAPSPSSSPLQAQALSVIHQEAAALEALARTLDDRFDRAIAILLKVKGRIIVSGMGKSGHISRKLAATLASTGSPAYFVHPAEASHGDLGMVSREDAMILLSVSGETKELSDMIAHAKRHHIPMITITQRKGSALDRAGDVSFILPTLTEACPMNLAPTTTSTMMLALGDALAVTLLVEKRFTKEDFHGLHPGGKLGQRLLKVEHLMHGVDQLPLVPLGTPMPLAVEAMSAKNWGCVGIVDENGAFVGIITDGDLRRHLDRNLLNETVDTVMSPHPKTIARDVLAVEAVRYLNECAITSLFVIEAGHPVGLLHIHDCLRAGLA